MALNVEELEETIALYHMSNYSLKQFNLQNYSVPIEAYGKQGIGKTSAALGALSLINLAVKVGSILTNVSFTTV